MKRLATLALPVALLLAAVTTAAVGAQGNDGSSYRLGPRDLISIKVFEVPELNVERRVSEEGTVAVPQVGELSVRGLTDTEVAARIKQLLEATLLQRATVAVEVREFRSQPISVIGAVKQPGNLDFSGRLTLLEALTIAGGLAENHGDTIYVLRRAANGLSDQIPISVEALLVRADPRVNIPIFSNDLINVTSSLPVTVYCLGEVANPGALTFSSGERITVLTAIARAGGLSDRAARKVLIRRQGSSGREMEVDFKRVLAGKDPDVSLEPGDVVVVKESFF